MNACVFKKYGIAFSVAAFLISCGGGGDIAGDSTDFLASPEKGTLTVISENDGDCSSAANGPWTVVTIVGGQAPFRIVNAEPGWLEVDRTEVTGKDPHFKARPTGLACGEVVVSILDYHSKLATYTYKIESKKASATVP